MADENKWKPPGDEEDEEEEEEEVDEAVSRSNTAWYKVLVSQPVGLQDR